jgi:probable phosphoglycerate mutase
LEDASFFKLTLMGNIYIMRHGESVVNRERRLTCRRLDGDLTAVGRDQSQKAARWLCDKPVSRIRCSPFHRAQQTAKIIGDVLGIEPVMDDDLREMDCGNLEGRTDDEAWAQWALVYYRWIAADWEAAFPDGETYRQGFERFGRALARIGADETALVVTHGGIARSVLPYLCVNAAALQRVGDLDNTGIVILEPYDAGRYACVSWNLIDHL